MIYWNDQVKFDQLTPCHMNYISSNFYCIQVLFRYVVHFVITNSVTHYLLKFIFLPTHQNLEFNKNNCQLKILVDKKAEGEKCRNILLLRQRLLNLFHFVFVSAYSFTWCRMFLKSSGKFNYLSRLVELYTCSLNLWTWY